MDVINRKSYYGSGYVDEIAPDRGAGNCTMDALGSKKFPSTMRIVI